MLGTRTQKVITRGISTQHQGSSESKNISYQAIPLLRPDEVMKMPAHYALILRSGFAPVKARQFIWYKESLMKDLPQPAVEIPQQTAQQRPFIRRQTKELDFELLD